MFRKLLLILTAVSVCLLANAQIVNRLRVDQKTFVRYAYCRMQQFNPENLAIADSIYTAGVRTNDYRLKCLGLSLEMPLRFALRQYERMDSTAVEMKSLLGERKEYRDFYFSFIHEYCEYLVHLGRASEAMLEARELGRMASVEKRIAGKMYSYRIIGLIHSARDNHHLAIRNLKEAASFCKAAHSEQDLPNLYLLLSQEYVKAGEFREAEEYVALAREYERFFPSISVKAKMTMAFICSAKGDWDAFGELYDSLVEDPLYQMQTDVDSRHVLDITYYRSRGLLEKALAEADSLGTMRGRFEQKHGIYAEMGKHKLAYDNLFWLMEDKDSVYIKVQNEDLAILDAEMHNAQLREEAQVLKARNQQMIMFGFLIMFAIAFLAILFNQWKLRRTLDEMRLKNASMLSARRAFQKAMDAKESENQFKIKILQNRKTNTFRL